MTTMKFSTNFALRRVYILAQQEFDELCSFMRSSKTEPYHRNLLRKIYIGKECLQPRFTSVELRHQNFACHSGEIHSHYFRLTQVSQVIFSFCKNLVKCDKNSDTTTERSTSTKEQKTQN